MDNNRPAMDAISGFVMNCMRRQLVERQIIQQNRSFGIHPSYESSSSSSGEDEPLVPKHENQHVEIPSPGVSPDIQVQVEWGDSSQNLQVGKDHVHPEDGDLDDFVDSFFDSNGWDNGNGNDEDEDGIGNGGNGRL